MDILAKISKELDISPARVQAAVKLMDEGCTVPFIARYRKEMTGTLSDEQLRDISFKLVSMRKLEKRREEIASAISAQDAMTDELSASIANAETLAVLEDLYLPYNKKRNTRASSAKAKGLEPLALAIYSGFARNAEPASLATGYVDAQKGVSDIAEALSGASDIIAEMLSDNAEIRSVLRAFIRRTASIHTEEAKDEIGTYAMYHDMSERAARIAPHRILAINRAEKEGALKVTLELNEEEALRLVCVNSIRDVSSACGAFVANAAADSLKRLILPSLENELRSSLFDAAAEQAIHVFALNLKPLLMQPPLKGRVTMGFDPAYRTGCKIAVVDETGKVLDVAVVYPTPPQSKKEEAKKALEALIKKHGVSVIAIGNGTASKESEIFVSDMLKELGANVEYAMVSEAGASVYSASKLGSEEFPQYDVSLRSAVSIARRLQDPLAELVKIDPQSIGVGQYQHDMPEKRLDETLAGVVEDCVNSVGVDVNTASCSLLSYVAGIGPSLAKNIVLYREENGAFSCRKDLLNVPKLGKKAFEQCAGFLRVPGGSELLDNTAVHPESYSAAKKLIKSCCGSAAPDAASLALIPLHVKTAGEEKTAEALGVGVPTLHDMINELMKPGRDPRDEIGGVKLRTDVMDINDLKPGMELEGTVRNVVDFGAFVDIGVHQDGLVHISRICERYIKHPSEVLHVGDIVTVKVLEVDAKRKRISLTMREA